MTVKNKSLDAKNEYLGSIKKKVEDLNFKIEALKMKLSIVPDSIQRYYLERIEIFSRKKEELDKTIMMLEGAEAGVWQSIQNKIESSWTDLKNGMDSIFDKFRNQVPDKEVFINRIEGSLAEINLNMAGYEKKFKENVKDVDESLSQKYDKQIERLVKNREFILLKIDELKKSESEKKIDLEVRESIANAMSDLKANWEETKTRFLCNV